MHQRIGIEFLSVFNLPPVQFVGLAADLGCRYISTLLAPLEFNPHRYPPYSLRDDAALRREMIAAMRDRGVSISLGEGFAVSPRHDVRSLAKDLEVMCELSVRRINTVSFDPDLARSFDQIAALVEMADAVDVETTLEFAPGMAIPDLPTALAAIRHVGRPTCQLLIDAMHLIRSGSSATDLAAVPPDLIGYAQLADAPLVPTIPNYMEEAMYERMVPGTGELPLREILAVLPPTVVIGLEVPLRSLAAAGVLPHARLAPCVEATRGLLAGLDD
jgi:sugar phosphate isomerase/epimerase